MEKQNSRWSRTAHSAWVHFVHLHRFCALHCVMYPELSETLHLFISLIFSCSPQMLQGLDIIACSKFIRHRSFLCFVPGAAVKLCFKMLL